MITTEQRKYFESMTEAQRDALCKKIAGEVMHSLEPQICSIAYHEAGHIICGFALGFELLDAHAGISEGLTTMNGPQEGHAASIGWVTQSYAGAEAAKLWASSRAERVAAHITIEQPSDGDLKTANEFMAKLTHFTNEPRWSIIASARQRAQTILLKYWPEVEEVADRLRQGKSISSIKLFLTCRVSRETI